MNIVTHTDITIDPDDIAAVIPIVAIIAIALCVAIKMIGRQG